jgi:hypothetical protein
VSIAKGSPDGVYGEGEAEGTEGAEDLYTEGAEEMTLGQSCGS